MMEIITVLLVAVLFTICGYFLIKGFSLQPDKSELILFPFSFALGAGLLAFQLYFYSEIGISWNAIFLLIPWVLLIVFVCIKQRKRLVLRYRRIRLGRVDYILISLLCVLLSFVAFESVLRPVVAWDGWAIWLMKSKIFYMDGRIYPDIFRYVESSYPILVSLMYTYAYVLLGRVDDISVLLLSFVFYSAVGITFYGYVRDKTTITYALLGTFLLLSTQNILRHGGRLEAGQADIILSLYILLCSIALIDFLKRKKASNLILLQLLLGITALIKNEGLLFSIFLQIYLVVWLIRQKQYAFIIYSVIWLIPVADWEYYKLSNNLPRLSEVFVGNSMHFDKIIPIGIAVVKEFFNLKNWNLLWILFFSVVILQNIKILKSRYLPLYILLFLQMGLYFFLYLIFPGNPVALVESSFNRLLLQLAPLSMLLSLLEIYPILKGERLFRKYNEIWS